MIFISKLIAKFVRTVLAIMTNSNEYIETSEEIVASIGNFTSSDKVIQPIKVVDSYRLPTGLVGQLEGERDGRFVFYAIGGGFVVTDTSQWNADSWRTANLTSWNRISNDMPLGLFANAFNRILPDGTTSPYGYTQINRITDEFGFFQGESVAHHASVWTGFENEPSRIKYLQRPGRGIVTFLYANRRIVLGNNWTWISNSYNSGDSMLSPGWFQDGFSMYQAYSPLEQEVLHRRIELPHPSAGMTVNNITSPLTEVVHYLSIYNAITEDVNGNIYSIHRNSGLFLSKNFEHQSHWLIDSLDTSRFRVSLNNYFAGERGFAEPKITCIEEDLFLTQYNKIFKLNNNLELQTIYEAPCMIEQISSDGLYLYLVSKGGIVKCLP